MELYSTLLSTLHFKKFEGEGQHGGRGVRGTNY